MATAIATTTNATRGSEHTLNMYWNVLFGEELHYNCQPAMVEEEEEEEGTAPFSIARLFSEDPFSPYPHLDEEEEEETVEEGEEEDTTPYYPWRNEQERIEELFSYHLPASVEDGEEETREEEGGTSQQTLPSLSSADFPDLLGGEVVVKKPAESEVKVTSAAEKKQGLSSYPTYQELFREMEEMKEEDALLGTSSSRHSTSSGNSDFDQRPKQVHPLMAEAIEGVCVGDKWMKVSKRAQMQKLMMEVASSLTKKVDSKKFVELGHTAPENVESLEYLAWLVLHFNDYNPHEKLTLALAAKAAEGDETTDQYRANRSLCQLIDLDSERKKEALVALHVILLLADSSCFISSLILRIQDHLEKCRPAQLQAIPLIVKIAGQLLLDLGAAPITNTSTSSEGVEETNSQYKELCEAKERLHSIFEEYIDDHKEAAIRTGILQPAEYGALLSEDEWDARHVEANGRCWYLTAVVEGFGGPSALELPVAALQGEDQYQIGVRFMWNHFNEAEVEALHDPKYFGVSGFRKIPLLKKELESSNYYRYVEKARRYSKMHTMVNDYFRKSQEDEDDDVREQLKGWAKNVKEGFAFYFTEDFFVRRCFETLNSESRPEYAGFRAMCIRVFEFFPRCPPEGSISRFADPEDAADEPALSLEERFNEFCYRDEYCAELHLENVAEFLMWLGYLKNVNVDQALREGEKLEELSRAELKSQELLYRQKMEHALEQMKSLEQRRNLAFETEVVDRNAIDVSALRGLDLLMATERTARLSMRPGGAPPRSLKALLSMKKK